MQVKHYVAANGSSYATVEWDGIDEPDAPLDENGQDMVELVGDHPPPTARVMLGDAPWMESGD